MPEINYSHLRYFHAVAHEGNLTRAAEMLHVSQSAVSVQIHKLEESLGARLFDRRGRSLVLTPAGRLALDHADAIFGLGDRLATALRKGQPEEALRVGALATLSRNFQVAFLAPVLERGDVRLMLRSGELRALLKQLESHRIDVLLSNQSPPRQADVPWIQHLIAEQPVALIGQAQRVGRRRQWRELLASEPLVLPSPESGLRSAFDALVHRLKITPRIAAEADDMAMLRLLVRQNVGLGVIPPVVVRDELAAGVLVQVAGLPGLKETFVALTLPREFPNPLLASLIQQARRTLTEPVAGPARSRRSHR